MIHLPLDPKVNSGLLHKVNLPAISLLDWMLKSAVKPTDTTWWRGAWGGRHSVVLGYLGRLRKHEILNRIKAQ